MSGQYLPTIGIECHVQLKTRTKLFAAVGNDARHAKPNTLVSHICFGLPGALPVLNKKAVQLAVKAAFALNTKPQSFSKFDRKHYFYPDLPKGYQISQFKYPIISGGNIEIEVDGTKKKVGITRAHLEEDAGKNTHPDGKDYSLVDLNRAGTPLLEIVSEPDIKSAKEAKAYARELYLLMKYAEVSDVNLFYGNMRFDVNVSISKDPKVLGIRSETKNLNSFKSVEKAVEYEIKRQTALLEKDQAVVQETRGWDDAKQKTVPQRGKEEAHDYRYFPDPDIPPLRLTEEFINDIQLSMPKLPGFYRKELDKIGLSPDATEVIINNPTNARFIHQLYEKHGEEHARRVANLMVNLSVDSDEEEEIKLSIKNAYRLSCMVKDNKLSSTAAKEVWQIITKTDEDPELVAKNKNMLQVSDEGELRRIVATVLSGNPKASEDVRNGEMKAIGFLVGQVMKESKGKANPALAQKLIKEELGL